MSGLKLYEIDSMFRAAMDCAVELADESGVYPDDWAEFLDDLQMERDAKCLAIAAIIKEKNAEADAMAEAAAAIGKRQRSALAVAMRLKNYLATSVRVGEKLADAQVAIGWRKSTSTVIDNEALLPESCFKIVREVSKTEVKAQIEAGVVLEGAHIETRHNLQVR